MTHRITPTEARAYLAMRQDMPPATDDATIDLIHLAKRIVSEDDSAGARTAQANLDAYRGLSATQRRAYDHEEE